METKNIFVDYAAQIANIKEEIITSIITMLEDRIFLDLVPYSKDYNGLITIEADTTELPCQLYEDITDCGTCQQKVAYRLEKRFNKWRVRWNESTDCEEDYYAQHETEEIYKNIPQFAGCEMNDLILLYNRVYKLTTGEITLYQERKKYNENKTEKQQEYITKLLTQLEVAMKNDDKRMIDKYKDAIINVNKYCLHL